MTLNFKPKSKVEFFGKNIYNLLVENFPQTFFVGGAVRDILLGKKVTDIDIATEATPEQLTNILSFNNINFSDSYKDFGNIVAKQGNSEVEITTLRKEVKAQNRYPQVIFIKSPKEDSKRRDFTVNSFYLSLKNNKIFDFNNGSKDLKNKKIKFIGNPKIRILEDPLRIIRGLRFALVLNFRLEKKTKQEIKNNFLLVNNLTKNKINKELKKISNKKFKSIIKKVINKPKLLDKYFK